MNPLLDKMLTTLGPLYQFPGSAVPLHHNSQGLSKSIDFETGLLLMNFIEHYRPETIVELGSFRGYSTAWLIAGVESNAFGIVHAFEVFPEEAYGSMWYKALGLPLNRFSYHPIPGGIWKYPFMVPESIDFIFHDTQHNLEPTRQEMDMLLPRVPVGGVVVIDDMCHPDYIPMQRYLERLFTGTSHGTWHWTVLKLGHGLGVALRLK